MQHESGVFRRIRITHRSDDKWNLAFDTCKSFGSINTDVLTCFLPAIVERVVSNSGGGKGIDEDNEKL